MRSVTYVLLAAVLFVACNNSSDNNTSESKDTLQPAAPVKEPANEVSFTVADQSVTTKAWNINLFGQNNSNGVSFNVTTTQADSLPAVNINVNSIQPGTYSFISGAGTLNSPNKAYGEYSPAAVNGKREHYFFQSGSVTISSIDTAKGILNASFEGEVKNEKGKSLTISNGKITEGVMQKGVTRF
ncbi:hypothetical protein ACFS6H_07530 [Terrimonas rubra]|uniref:Lipocalin-like domain-containing protein n=1 Tax=Terrimonas rubra TaxID=1035890 RepID=A0ABW6A517_9BACT